MHALFRLTVSVFFTLCVIACQGQNKVELVQDGKQLLEQDNPLGAVVYFRNALEKDPNYTEARYQLGQAYLQAGKLGQAKTEFNKVYLQNPANAEVLLDLALISLAEANLAEAKGWVELFLNENAKCSRSQHYLGVVYQHQGDTQRAEELYGEAIAIDESYIDASAELVRLYLGLGRNDEALSTLQRAIKISPENKELYKMLATVEVQRGNLDSALNAYRKVIQIDPAAVTAYYFAGMLSFDMGTSFEQTEEFAGIMKRRFPDHPATARLNGILAFVKADLEHAATELRNSLKQMPDLSGYYFLGLTQYSLKNYELALNQFQKALDLDPEHLQSRVLLGMTLLQQHRIDDSIYQLSQVLLADDNLAIAHNVIGTAYLARNDFDAATKHFDRAITLDPHLADPYVKKGLLNLSQNDGTGAEMELVRALEVAPEALSTRFLLASLYLQQNNFQGVIDLLTPALDGSERDAILYNYMAAAYLAQKKTEEGIKALQEAKAIRADYLTPYFNLANVYLLQKQPERAEHEYASILKIAPANIRALIALASLQELSGNTIAAKKTYAQARLTGEAQGFLALAGYHFRAGNADEYAHVIEAAYTAHPSHPNILNLRGRLKLGQKNFPEAITTFEALAKADPEAGGVMLAATWLASGEPAKATALARERIKANSADPGGYLLLAAVQQQLGLSTEAEQTLLQGSSQVQDARPLLLRLAGLYLPQQRMQEAEKILRDLYRNSPEYTPAVFTLALVLDQRGSKKEAQKLYQEVLKVNNAHTGAMNNLAYLYAENNAALEEGLLLAFNAFRNEPSNPAILDTLGYVLIKHERYAEAVDVLKKASELLPDMAPVRLHHAQALIGAGKQEEAIQELKHVITLKTKPESGQAQELLNELSSR